MFEIDPVLTMLLCNICSVLLQGMRVGPGDRGRLLYAAWQVKFEMCAEKKIKEK